jgi:hypothetical protein
MSTELQLESERQGEQIAALEARLVRLEAACVNLLPAPVRPPVQQSDHYLDRMLARSTDEVVKRMVAVVDDKLMADIVADNRRGR